MNRLLAFILFARGAFAARLTGWVDMPWCPADLHFIRKLSLVLDAAAGGQ